MNLLYMGLLNIFGWLSGGLINILINDLVYKEKSSTYYVNNIMNIHVKHFNNYGAYIGLFGGLYRGYYNKPVFDF